MSRYQGYPHSKSTTAGWIEHVPVHWNEVKAHRIIEMISGSTPSRDNPSYWGGNIPWVSPKDMKVARIKDSKERISESARVECGMALLPYPVVLIVVRGMILAHTFPVAITEAPVTINQDMKAMRLKSDVVPEFFSYYLQGSSKYILSLVEESGHGTKRLDSETWKQLKVWLPPTGEQHLIITFLDRETAKIDTLIQKKQRLIKLLDEKRAALISHAVTKGLDPSASMRESGVEWIGEIPTRWTVARFGHVIKSICDGPFGSSLRSAHYTKVGVRVIRLQNIGVGFFKDSDRVYISQGRFENLPGHEVLPGDLLIAGLGDVNHPVCRACTLPLDIEVAMVKADCFRLRLDSKAITHNYAVWYLCSDAARAIVARSTRGTTRSRVNLSGVSNLPIIIPSLAEQQRVCKYLADLDHHLQPIIKKTRTAISKLSEYRSALISAAVTGQIDVRNEV